MTRKWLGYIFSDFFTNSSGHPDPNANYRPNQSTFILSRGWLLKLAQSVTAGWRSSARTINRHS
jgi:hypothetical protein